MVERLNKVTVVERQLVQQLGRSPEPEEIAAELALSAAEVAEVLRIARPPVSLQKPVGDEEESALGEFIADDQAESAFESASLRLRRSDIEKALSWCPRGNAPCSSSASACTTSIRRHSSRSEHATD